MRLVALGLAAGLLLAGAGSTTAQQALNGTWSGTTTLILPTDESATYEEFGMTMHVTEGDSGVRAEVSMTSPGGDPLLGELTGEHRPNGHLVLHGTIQGAQVELDAAPDGGGALFGRLLARAGEQVIGDGTFHVTPQP